MVSFHSVSDQKGRSGKILFLSHRDRDGTGTGNESKQVINGPDKGMLKRSMTVMRMKMAGSSHTGCHTGNICPRFRVYFYLFFVEKNIFRSHVRIVPVHVMNREYRYHILVYLCNRNKFLFLASTTANCASQTVLVRSSWTNISGESLP